MKVKEKQLEKALATIGENPHVFKADWVGKANVSRFDIVRDDLNRLILMSKDGKVLIPTNVGIGW